MSKLFTLYSDIFLEDDEYHQISEYLNGKNNPHQQEFLTENAIIAFYEKHRHDSDDSI